MNKFPRIHAKLLIAVYIIAALIGLSLGYLQFSRKQAENTPWVIFVKKENRDNSSGQDSHIPCLKKIDAKYSIDDEDNLLVKQGQASKVSDSCS